MLCVFDCVVQKVREDLFYAHLIAEQFVRQRSVHVNDKLEPLVARLVEGDIAQVVKHRAKLVRRFHEIHLAFLDLGKIQDVVYQREQVVPCILDVACIQQDVLDRIFTCLVLMIREFLRGSSFPQDHLVHAEHGVDRRSYLMRHVS